MNRSGQIAVVLLTGIVLGSLAVAADNVATVPGQTPPSLAQEREQLMKLKMTTPAITPGTEPTPPVVETPPTTQEAIASSS